MGLWITLWSTKPNRTGGAARPLIMEGWDEPIIQGSRYRQVSEIGIKDHAVRCMQLDYILCTAG